MSVELNMQQVIALEFILNNARERIINTNEELGITDAISEVPLATPIEVEMYHYAEQWVSDIIASEEYQAGNSSLSSWVKEYTKMDSDNLEAMKNIRIAMLSWMIASLYAEFPEYI